ncbi:MAG: GNAT family N-acetyltransferase [Nitrososphaerota archaeon]|nr:GNAT family N-acetyltransferase [Candidatus Bathyarchaeota archaeon]MCX8162096.1 GNAT family N-acetyltransferase [Candidatus Bathyarchaeota archaeon]MDW8062092.1 GNAT family N-acetyltransferase [Nitrososphaerota archaeon]
MRRYRYIDADAVVDLLKQLVFLEGKPSKARLIKRFLRRVSRNGVILVAEVNGRIVGAGGGYIIGSMENVEGERYGFIEFLVVDESYRGMGIGRSILLNLIDKLKARGVSEVYLEVNPRNEAALSLYRSLGFTVSYLTMNLKIDRASTDGKL